MGAVGARGAVCEGSGVRPGPAGTAPEEAPARAGRGAAAGDAPPAALRRALRPAAGPALPEAARRREAWPARPPRRRPWPRWWSTRGSGPATTAATATPRRARRPAVSVPPRVPPGPAPRGERTAAPSPPLLPPLPARFSPDRLLTLRPRLNLTEDGGPCAGRGSSRRRLPARGQDGAGDVSASACARRGALWGGCGDAVHCGASVG